MKSVDNNEIITKTTEFVTSGIQLFAQRTGEDVLTWQIDGNGSVLGFVHNNDVYFYIKNAQGDILGISDSNGNIVANYLYDSWGKLISVTDNSGTEITDLNHIGHKNPLRYRGYYHDDETQLYYLNARYYDPETGRFINADDNLEGGLNLFCYCGNNPVNLSDPAGRDPGDKFPSLREALIDAARYINRLSLDNDREYAVSLSTMEDGFKYSTPVVGIQNKLTKEEYAPLFESAFIMLLHSHGAWSWENVNNKFSPDDMRFAKNWEMVFALVSPNGAVQIYDSRNGKTKEILPPFNDQIPYDKNHYDGWLQTVRRWT